MTKAPSHRLQIILSVSEYEKLAKRAQETGAPLAEIIRRALAATEPKKGGKS